MVAGDVVNTAARLQGRSPRRLGHRGRDDDALCAGCDRVRAARSSRGEGKARADTGLARFGGSEPLGVDTDRRAGTLFVGRDTELALLTRPSLERLREPSVQLVTVVGEPGLGKSRLVWEFRQEIDQRPELVHWRQGRCLPYGEGITFWALGEIVKAEAGILESDSPTQALDEALRSLADTVSDESERAWFIARLSPLVGARRTRRASDARRRSRPGAASRGASRPAAPVLVLEDLHWADDALSTSSSTSSTGPQVRRSWFWRRPDPSSTTRRPAGVEDAELGDRRSLAARGQGHRTSRLRAARPFGAPGRDASGAARTCRRQPALHRAVRAHARRSRGRRRGSAPETVQALIAARRHARPRVEGASPGRLGSREGLLGRCPRGDGRSFAGGHPRRPARPREARVRPARAGLVHAERGGVLVLACARPRCGVPADSTCRSSVEARDRCVLDRGERGRTRLRPRGHPRAPLRAGLGVGARRGRGSGLEPRGRLGRFLTLAGDRAMQLDVVRGGGGVPKSPRALGGVCVQGPCPREARRCAARAGPAVGGRGVYEEAIEALGSADDELGAALAMSGLARALWRHGKTARSRGADPRVDADSRARSPGPGLVFAYGRAAGMNALGGRPHEAIEWAEKGITLARRARDRNVVRHLQMRGIARIELDDMRGLEDIREGLDLSLRLGLGIETDLVPQSRRDGRSVRGTVHARWSSSTPRSSSLGAGASRITRCGSRGR